jgi:hypothetical protein
MSIVVKSDTPDQQIAYGEVYAPHRYDADEEWMTPVEIRKAAHKFASEGRMNQIDVMHDGEVVEDCRVVESFIARKGDPDFIPDSWVVGVYIPDPELWAKVKKGEINGFSMEAFITRHEAEHEIEIPPVVQGMTSKSENHEHRFYVTYDENGVFKGGTTDVVNGHNHQIVAGTHTQVTKGHSHRFSSVDDVTIMGGV